MIIVDVTCCRIRRQFSTVYFTPKCCCWKWQRHSGEIFRIHFWILKIVSMEGIIDNWFEKSHTQCMHFTDTLTRTSVLSMACIPSVKVKWIEAFYVCWELQAFPLHCKIAGCAYVTCTIVILISVLRFFFFSLLLTRINTHINTQYQCIILGRMSNYNEILYQNRGTNKP